MQNSAIKFWLELDPMCEWHLEYYMSIRWMGMLCKSVHAFRWKALELVREVHSLKFEPTIKDKVMKQRGAFPICFCSHGSHMFCSHGSHMFWPYGSHHVPQCFTLLGYPKKHRVLNFGCAHNNLIEITLLKVSHYFIFSIHFSSY